MIDDGSKGAYPQTEYISEAASWWLTCWLRLSQSNHGEDNKIWVNWPSLEVKGEKDDSRRSFKTVIERPEARWCIIWVTDSVCIKISSVRHAAEQSFNTLIMGC